jgi:hypothetical protein
MALIEGETLQSSAKRYDFQAHVGGVLAGVVGIGAVFTPSRLRGQGHARTLINLLLEDAIERGCGYALLFSEIDPSYYEALGFVQIPRRRLTIEVAPPAGAPATLVRSGERLDLPAVADLSARYRADAAFALDRPPDMIEYALTRRRLLAGLGPADLRRIEFFVAEEGRQAAAYVVLSHGPGGVVLEECGDRDPQGARVGAILQTLAAREPSNGPLRLSTWLPDSIRPPQIEIVSETEAPEIMMVRPLGDTPMFDLAGGPVIFWLTDLF